MHRELHLSARFTVTRSGIQATLQDEGRPHHRALGVPVSGALDRAALHLVNALVRNPANTAAIEMLYSGIALELSGACARVALAGANATIERPGASALALPEWQTALLQPGDRLRVAAPACSAAAYLAVEGGYAVPEVLGSASTYVQGALGGHQGRALRAGDVLMLCSDAMLDIPERRYGMPPALAQPDVLRVILGPQRDRFTDDAVDRLLSAPYRVTPASNRTGLRLDGPVLEHAKGHDLLSEAVATGSIQVPGSGQPVLLLADHPTVGGYPKIATLISADWAAAGRLRIGATVRFELADDAAAARARRDQREWIADRIATIEATRG